MQNILRVFLTRILTLGMLIVSALVIGFFPIDLRNASAVTLFTVGIPTALLAVWARPGRLPRETLQQTLARFVVPAAALGSFIGLLVATIVLLLGDVDYEAGLMSLEDVDGAARTAVTAFLVYVGVLVLLFVEPPHRFFAVVEPVSPDRRPTYLALALGIGFFIVLLVPPFRAFFNLHSISVRDTGIVAIGVATWAVLVWIFWRGRFIDRFLGMTPPVTTTGTAKTEPESEEAQLGGGNPPETEGSPGVAAET
jgi:cation-transporting ATPase E